MSEREHDDRDNEDDRIRRYLLGQLPEEEAHALERDLLADREPFQLAEAVEADLLDEYVRGQLAPAEREHLRGGLLATRGGRKRRDLARDLAAAAERAKVVPFWRRTLRDATATPARRWTAAAAGLLLVAGLWAGWPAGPREEGEVASRPPVPAPPAVQPARPPVTTAPVQPSTAPAAPSMPSPTAAPAVPGPDVRGSAPAAPPVALRAVIELALAVQRSAGEVQRAEVDPRAAEIELRLDVEGESFEAFRITLRDAGGDVASERLAARQLDGVPTLTLTLPAAELPDGSYEVEVLGLKPDETEELISSQELEVVRKR